MDKKEIDSSVADIAKLLYSLFAYLALLIISFVTAIGLPALHGKLSVDWHNTQNIVVPESKLPVDNPFFEDPYPGDRYGGRGPIVSIPKYVLSTDIPIMIILTIVCYAIAQNKSHEKKKKIFITWFVLIIPYVIITSIVFLGNTGR